MNNNYEINLTGAEQQHPLGTSFIDVEEVSDAESNQSIQQYITQRCDEYWLPYKRVNKYCPYVKSLTQIRLVILGGYNE